VAGETARNHHSALVRRPSAELDARTGARRAREIGGAVSLPRARVRSETDLSRRWRQRPPRPNAALRDVSSHGLQSARGWRRTDRDVCRERRGVIDTS
jgi:hypothetical protein